MRRGLALGAVAAIACALAGTAAADPPFGGENPGPPPPSPSPEPGPPELVRVGGEAEPPVVSVVTYGEGEPLFEKWGHGALCFAYPHSGRDPVCFNWGVTDFDDTFDLAWGFIRGQQQFWLDEERETDMFAEYREEDRDAFIQTLALSPEAARAVEAGVIEQLSGPNHTYTYDHFFDNCTTRIRDVLDRATHGALRGGSKSDAPFPLTFREMALRGIAEFPWLHGLSDYVTGHTLDAHPTLWQAMFLPDVLRAQIAARFGVQPVVLTARASAPYPTSGPSGAWRMLAVALVFALPLAFTRRRWAIAWATVWLAGWGLLLWAVAVLSPIPALRWNEVLLVLVPFDLALPFLSAPRRGRYARWRVIELLAISALCALGAFRQPLWVPVLSAIAPLALIARPPRD